MRQGTPSHTALRVAIRRAAHQLLDRPVVFDDPLAVRILGPDRSAELLDDPSRQNRGMLPRYLRAFFAARSRVAEETLARTLVAGNRQYVVLGAGLDTFAYRHRDPADTLRVFEVDHPATQEWKQALLDQAGIDVPSTVTFVPVDFETQSIETELIASGFDLDAGSFFSWLGVVPYLARESISAALETIARATQRGGGVVFDYGVPPSTLGPVQRAVFETMAARVSAAGEPWRTFLETGDLLRELRALGFRDTTNLDGEALNERYFTGRLDGLRVGGLGHVVIALNPFARKS